MLNYVSGLQLGTYMGPLRKVIGYCRSVCYQLLHHLLPSLPLNLTLRKVPKVTKFHNLVCVPIYFQACQVRGNRGQDERSRRR